MPDSSRYLVVLFKAIRSTKAQSSKKLAFLSESEYTRHLSEIVHDPHIAQALCSPFSQNQERCFQGIFDTGHQLIQSVFRLREALYPDCLQFSIGIGGINTPINPVMATDIEGPAFEQAQAGLSQAPKSGHFLSFSGFSKTLERTLSPSVALLWTSTRSWNLNRLKILNQRLQGHTESAISQNLQISERAVYKNIAQAQLGHWVDLIHAVEDSFSRLVTPTDTPASLEKIQRAD